MHERMFLTSDMLGWFMLAQSLIGSGVTPEKTHSGQNIDI